MRSTTLASILDRHSAPSVIDYLSIDIEGAEYEVLCAFPFDRYTFLAITVEHNNFRGREIDASNQKALHSLLTGHGYRRVRSGPVDDYYRYYST